MISRTFSYLSFTICGLYIWLFIAIFVCCLLTIDFWLHWLYSMHELLHVLLFDDSKVLDLATNSSVHMYLTGQFMQYTLGRYVVIFALQYALG